MLTQMYVGGVMACTHEHAPASQRISPTFPSAAHKSTLSSRSYDVSPDGQRFLMLKPPPFDPATAPQIVLVQDWFEELKRLVPTN
jgi:hypothetical protein